MLLKVYSDSRDALTSSRCEITLTASTAEATRAFLQAGHHHHLISR